MSSIFVGGSLQIGHVDFPLSMFVIEQDKQNECEQGRTIESNRRVDGAKKNKYILRIMKKLYQ